jgi:hypothetical protein
MKKQLAIGVVLILIVAGCAIHTAKVETGKKLNESSIAKIADGETTGAQILVWFGAPSKSTKLGAEELFVYKQCTYDSSSVTITAIGHTGSKEKCDELSIVLDENGIVKNHGFVPAPK